MLKTTDVSYDKTKRQFFSECSSMNGSYVLDFEISKWASIGRGELVIALITKDGKMVTYREEKQNSLDGEIISTLYVPTPKTLREYPQAKGTTFLVFND